LTFAYLVELRLMAEMMTVGTVLQVRGPGGGEALIFGPSIEFSWMGPSAARKLKSRYQDQWRGA
jgi:hypothetical protein